MPAIRRNLFVVCQYRIESRRHRASVRGTVQDMEGPPTCSVGKPAPVGGPPSPDLAAVAQRVNDLCYLGSHAAEKPHDVLYRRPADPMVTVASHVHLPFAPCPPGTVSSGPPDRAIRRPRGSGTGKTDKSALGGGALGQCTIFQRHYQGVGPVVWHEPDNVPLWDGPSFFDYFLHSVHHGRLMDVFCGISAMAFLCISAVQRPRAPVFQKCQPPPNAVYAVARDGRSRWGAR
jgi:hypothetical protein